MTEIQQNRWDRLIRRVAGIVGGGSQVNDTLNELFPTIDVERVPGELLALAGFRLGWCSSLLGPSVGNFNHHQLFNPAGSSLLLSVTGVWVTSAVGQIIRVGIGSVARATLVGNERRRDTRAGVLADTVGQNRSEQTAAGGFLEFRMAILADENNKVEDTNTVAILFPGTGITVSTETLNTQSRVSFMWRERVFEPSELVS